MRDLRRVLLHNWAWKLGSLGLAIVLWFAVEGEPELITVQAAGVYYENLPEDLVIVSDVPDSVQVELRGPPTLLGRQTLSGTKILLNLSAVAAPGQQSYTISSRDVSLPDGVSFLSAAPSRVFLEFDKRISKEVPVRVDLKGSPASGFKVSGQTVYPPTVRVSGPQARLRDLEAAQTDAVEISGLDHDVTVKVNAFLSDALLQLGPHSVTVDIAIERGKTSP